MRPGQIRVFDGLRVTAEHLAHFQGSLHSAIHDLRELAGAGRVQRGLEVVAGEMSSITVRPGLAFDGQNNRIVCDEPVTLALDVAGDAPRYVCVRYLPVEDGVVEGRATLVWDSCEVFVTTTPPAVEDNVIVLARVQGTVTGELDIQPAQIPAGTASLQPAEQALQQGIVALAPADADAAALGNAFLDLLRDSTAPGSDGALPVRFELAQANPPLAFRATGLTTLTTVWVKVSAEVDATVEGEPRPRQSWSVYGSAHGEATFSGERPALHALSAHVGGRSTIDDGVLCRLQLGDALDVAPAALRGMFATADLRVVAEPTPGGFAVRAYLHRDGEAVTTLLEEVAARRPTLEWGATVAWKINGSSNRMPQAESEA